ncbi:methyltransferase domain-containing protein [Actinoplanes solisilvae]|uniref:methyltransferase domain-containing protein n=1 Tax=Actinoplanes solisilvae TaxID=2486853 RepID=UPI0013E33A8E|nr:methyltransferase domain-containing protein [Actinoplanes solisilvae]
MVRVFGEVAALYDDVRPGYPDQVRQAILDYGGPPASIVELGAGTGKGTELLTAFDCPITALEPDPRMADVLRAKFPRVEVLEVAYEEWRPPAKGPDLIACAMAWHWMDAATRNRRAVDALAPGGVLAVFQHKYAYADPSQAEAISDVLNRIDPSVVERPDHWVRDDVRDAGVWADVRERRVDTYPVFSKRRYLELMQTFSPFRRRSPEDQQRVLDGLGALLDDFGGAVTLELRTTSVLARKG